VGRFSPREEQQRYSILRGVQSAELLQDHPKLPTSFYKEPPLGAKGIRFLTWAFTAPGDSAKGRIRQRARRVGSEPLGTISGDQDRAQWERTTKENQWQVLLVLPETHKIKIRKIIEDYK